MALRNSHGGGRARQLRLATVAASIAMLAAAALLGGCDDLAAHRAAQRKAAEQQQRDAARDRCIRIGFTPATSDFAACVRAELARLGSPPPNPDNGPRP